MLGTRHPESARDSTCSVSGRARPSSQWLHCWTTWVVDVHKALVYLFLLIQVHAVEHPLDRRYAFLRSQLQWITRPASVEFIRSEEIQLVAWVNIMTCRYLAAQGSRQRWKHGRGSSSELVSLYASHSQRCTALRASWSLTFVSVSDAMVWRKSFNSCPNSTKLCKAYHAMQSMRVARLSSDTLALLAGEACLNLSEEEADHETMLPAGRVSPTAPSRTNTGMKTVEPVEQLWRFEQGVRL